MATPLSGTNIRLLSNIPWKSDYKNTRYFPNVATQTSWFTSKTPVFTLAQANFVKIEGKQSVKVPYHIDKLWNVNYMMFQNRDYNNKWFYCFVTKLEYINKENTLIHFELDVFQTWFLNTTFKPSYVERHHQTEYVNGQPVISTLDEGLDYGTMYDTIAVEQVKPSGDVLFLVIVCKERLAVGGRTDNGTIVPTINGSPQPLTFYIHPFKRDGSDINVLPNTVSKVTDVMTALYTHEGAVNNVVSMYVTDYIGLDVVNSEGDTVTMPTDYFTHVTVMDTEARPFDTYMLSQMYTYQTKTIGLGSKYKGLNTAYASKLNMSPYYQIILDDFQGNRVEIKPEYIKSDNLAITVKGSIGTSNKVSYNVLNYNYESVEPHYDQVSNEYGLINSNPNDVPIITDLLSAYLQGNRNSIQNQENSLKFNGIANVIGGISGGITSVLSKDVMGAVGSVGGVVTGAGNTVLQLQSIQAKQKDIDNVPPSISNMGGNNYYTLGNGYRGLYVIYKRIKDEYRDILNDFFKRYGYKTNRNIVPNIHTRQHWNYVKTIDVELEGSLPQEDLIALQSVFDNGVTLWHTDDIGNYNLTNGIR